MSEQQLPVPLPPHMHLSLPFLSHTPLHMDAGLVTLHYCVWRPWSIQATRVSQIRMPLACGCLRLPDLNLERSVKHRLLVSVWEGEGEGVQMFTQLNVHTMNTHCSLFSRGRFVMFTVRLTHRLQNWGS